jgi:hypothetical protein
MRGNPYDFSFSGIKTAMLYHLRRHPEFEPEIADASKPWRAENAKPRNYGRSVRPPRWT